MVQQPFFLDQYEKVYIAKWWIKKIYCCYPLDAEALRFLGWCRAGSATTCVPPRATLLELQSKLQLAATCAGHEDFQAEPNCDPNLAPTSAGLGLHSQRYGVGGELVSWIGQSCRETLGQGKQCEPR